MCGARQLGRSHTWLKSERIRKTQRHKDTEAQRRASKVFYSAPLCLCVFVSLCFSSRYLISEIKPQHSFKFASLVSLVLNKPEWVDAIDIEVRVIWNGMVHDIRCLELELSA